MDIQATDDFINYIIALKNRISQQDQQVKSLTEELTRNKVELDALKKKGEKK